LFLGADAFALASQKIEDLKREMEQWKHITVSTGFPKEELSHSNH
jgi:hypothetical protein